MEWSNLKRDNIQYLFFFLFTKNVNEWDAILLIIQLILFLSNWFLSVVSFGGDHDHDVL